MRIVVLYPYTILIRVPKWVLGVLALILVVGFLNQSIAQSDHPKIGIVLSGGSAKGIAHVGVLKVLEAEGIPIDVITGTSMGAIAGGLYALGYSAHQLEQFVTDRDWQTVFSDAVRRSDQNLSRRVSGQGVLISLPSQGMEIKIPSGVISGQEVMALLSEWTWPFQEEKDLSHLPIPFTAIATNLRTGDAFPLTNVSLPLALRASMSIPTLFAPVNLFGVLYVDGGLSRNIPAVDAIDLGADFLIGVDVSTPAENLKFDDATLVDVMLYTATYQGIRSDIRQRELLDVNIRPDISGLSITDFSKAQEWIERGEAAARAALPQINRMLDSLNIPRTARSLSIPAFQPKQIDSLVVVGVDDTAKDLVRKRLGLVAPVSVTPQMVSEAVSRVYATGLFELVTYHFSLLPNGNHLLSIHTTAKKTQDKVGLGIRYDSENAAQVLFTLALRNRLSYGSISEFRVSVGKQNQVRALFLSSNGVENRLSLGLALDYANAPIRFFLPPKFAESILVDPDVPVLSLGLDVFSVGLWGGFALAPSTLASLSIKTDVVQVGKEVAAISQPLIPASDNLLSVQTGDHSVLVASFGVDRDTFNNRSFPTEGMKLDIKVAIGSSNAEPSLATTQTSNRSTFQFFRFDAQGYVPVSSALSVFGRTVLSIGAGDALPISYYSFIGGVRPTTVLPGMFIPLYGLASQARFGRKAFMGAVGVQWEPKKDVFTRFVVNGGGTYDLLLDNEKGSLGSDDYDLIRQKPTVGFGFEVGLRTPLGPASVIFSSSESGTIPDIRLSVGYSF